LPDVHGSLGVSIITLSTTRTTEATDEALRRAVADLHDNDLEEAALNATLRMLRQGKSS
jgi:hypothetical protein